jgi:uncharacterized protein (DUF885 family)
VEDFFRDFTDEWMRHSPESATRNRYFTGPEQDALERRLTPQTPAEDRKRIALARRGLKELATFDRAKMTPTERKSAGVMQWQLEMVVEREPYIDFTFPLEQMNGYNVDIVEEFTISRPVTKPRDAENYVAALGQVAERMTEATANARRLASKGVLPPRFILEATLKQMRSFVDPAPASNPFVTSLAEKMPAIADLPSARRDVLRAEAERIVGQKIYPAWRGAIAALESQLPRSTNDAGVWRLKGGPDFYKYALKRYTTTNRTAEEIHDLGLRQVAAIEGRMETLLQRLGRTGGSVKERIAKLETDMQYPNPASEASREQVIKDFSAIIRDAEQRAASMFDTRPKAPVEARPFPTFSENNAAASYNLPAPDGSRPGIVQYPRRIEYMTRFGMRTLAYHEAVPGHHFQLALELEDQALPRFMRLHTYGNISAIAEGWALYAERLASESGWYEGDIEGELGQLNDELFRARRLVVDTGLHAKRWTRQQAIDYGIEASEVERYVVWPGQACSYMVGQLKILELRDKARTALGAKFSLREFHNTVLNAGSVPLTILEQAVTAYIAANAA